MRNLTKAFLLGAFKWQIGKFKKNLVLNFQSIRYECNFFY